MDRRTNHEFAADLVAELRRQQTAGRAYPVNRGDTGEWGPTAPMLTELGRAYLAGVADGHDAEQAARRAAELDAFGDEPLAVPFYGPGR